MEIEKGLIKELLESGVGIEWEEFGYHFYNKPTCILERSELIKEETTMIKIKAGVKVSGEDDKEYLWLHGKDYLNGSYSFLKLWSDDTSKSIAFEFKIGSKENGYIPIEEANELIKPYGFEIIETESIETLEGLEIFCNDNNLYRKGNSFVYINDNKEMEVLNVEDIEVKFDIELTVLKGE